MEVLSLSVEDCRSALAKVEGGIAGYRSLSGRDLHLTIKLPPTSPLLLGRLEEVPSARAGEGFDTSRRNRGGMVPFKTELTTPDVMMLRFKTWRGAAHVTGWKNLFQWAVTPVAR